MPLPSYAVAFAGPRHAVSLGPVSAFGLVNSDFTVEAWLRLDSTEGDSPVLGTDERRPNEGLHLSIREGRPYLGFYENDTAAPLRIGAGQWHHLAWRYSKEFGEQAIFLDGVAIARATGRLPFGGSGNLWVGRWGQRRWFHGAIADVRIWEEARSEASIAEAARGEDSPVGALCHLRSDGPALLPPGAAPKVDLSPLRVQGPQSLPPPPLLASPSLGLPASALRFAGGAWLGLVYAPTLGITLGDFTASAWIRLRAVGRGDQVILGGRTAKPRRGLHLSIRDGKPYFGFYASDLAGRRKLEAERWTHVSWRYSALAQRMDIFVDGAPDSSASPRPPYL
jgi:Concanavalin A-like lectin/glucanases superfamily